MAKTLAEIVILYVPICRYCECIGLECNCMCDDDQDSEYSDIDSEIERQADETDWRQRELGLDF